MPTKSQREAGWPLRFVADADVAAINPGYDTKNGQSYPFVSMDDVRDGCRGIAGFSSRLHDSSGYTVFKNGDTIFAKITPCTENGKIALVRELPGDVGLGSTEFIVLSPRTSIIPEFLYYQLIRGDVRALCASLMEGSTGRQRVPTSIFRKRVRIPVPASLGEQCAVAAALAMFDYSISATETAIAAAQRLQRGLMRKLLVGRIRADGIARTDREFTIHPKLGMVPRGWEATKGRSLFKLHGAYFPGALSFVSEPHRADCLFMKVDDFNNPLNAMRIVRTEISLYLGEHAARFKTCAPGWLVIAKRGAAITHNRVRLLARTTLLDPNLMAIQMLGGHSAEYFRYLLTHMNLSRFLEVSSVPQLNNKDLYPRWFAMPPPPEQTEIVERLNGVSDLIEAKRAKITALQRVKKSLMQNLLTGRIRLSPEALAALTKTPKTVGAAARNHTAAP